MALVRNAFGVVEVPADSITVDPTVSPGWRANQGSFVFNKSTGILYFKTGASDMEWLALVAGAISAAQVNSSIVLPNAGAALANADATINPATDLASEYQLPTLTANRVLTLGIGGTPTNGQVVTIIRRDLTAHTYTVKDSAATSLFVFPSAPAQATGASFYYDSTSSLYKFLSFYYVR